MGYKSNDKCPYKRHTVEGGYVKTKAETILTQSQVKNTRAGSHQTLKKGLEMELTLLS